MTDAQARTIAPVTEAAAHLAKAVASIVVVQDIQDVLFAGAALPACPRLLSELDGDTILLDFDYGLGCSTAAYPEASFAGIVGGDYFFAVNAIEFLFTDLTVNQTIMSGRVAGGVAPAADRATFAVNVSVTAGDGAVTKGGATVVFDRVTGLTTISDATITVESPATDATALVLDVVVLEDVVVDASATGDFKPRSGVARFDLPQDAGSTTDAMRLEFLDDTPMDGSLEISINSADPFVFVPD